MVFVLKKRKFPARWYGSKNFYAGLAPLRNMPCHAGGAFRAKPTFCEK